MWVRRYERRGTNFLCSGREAVYIVVLCGSSSHREFVDEQYLLVRARRQKLLVESPRYEFPPYVLLKFRLMTLVQI